MSTAMATWFQIPAVAAPSSCTGKCRFPVPRAPEDMEPDERGGGDGETETLKDCEHCNKNSEENGGAKVHYTKKGTARKSFFPMATGLDTEHVAPFLSWNESGRTALSLSLTLSRASM